MTADLFDPCETHPRPRPAPPRTRVPPRDGERRVIREEADRLVAGRWVRVPVERTEVYSALVGTWLTLTPR
jgi:hypothetical protein